MTVRDLLKHKTLFNICLTLFSFELHFNHNISYSSKNKDWILINGNVIIWDHKYAELHHLLNNIVLCKYDNTELEYIQKMTPYKYVHSTCLENLIYPNYTKYEVFTSYIINKCFLGLRYKTVIAIHIKHTRSEDDKSDIASFSYLCDVINTQDRRVCYRISDTSELNNTDDVLSIISKLNSAKIFMFTDWRALYRNNLSLSQSKYAIMPRVMIKNIVNAGCSFYGIVVNNKSMFAIDLLT